MKRTKGIFFIIFAIILLLFSPCINSITSDFINPKVTLSNANQNFLSEDLDLNFKVKLMMRLGHFPSVSSCIIKNGSIVWYNGYGKAKLFPKKVPTLDTIYPIGSISKTVTATAVMQLWEKGLFDLDDDINDFLDFKIRNPYYPDAPITFRMLLAHHSSLTSNNKLQYLYLFYLFIIHKKDYPFPLIKEIITPGEKFFISDIWENFKPGTKKFYSNFNYILLEHLIEVLSGQTFSEYCKQNIFEPLNMHNTSFYFDDLKNKELAVSYHNFGGIYYRIPYTDIGYSYGGLKTSINDFSHYAMAYINEGMWNNFRLLKESTIDMMLTVQYENTSRYSRQCLGWQRFGGFWNSSSTFGHVGHVPGGSGAIFMNAEENYASIFFINRYIFFKRPRVLFAWFMLCDLFSTKINEL
jgi:CubicO group peptidase (beta-lactamase class C family)